MDVGELIVKLQKYNLKTRVVMSKDGEGNIFSPIDEITSGIYTAESSWHGGFTDDEDELRETIMGEQTEMAICLWPIN